MVIDELSYTNLRPEQANVFFKLMEERYRRRPTIITTNLEYEEWYAFFGRKDMVAALLDRVRHHCVTIRLNGPSLRVPDEATAELPQCPPASRSQRSRKRGEQTPAGNGELESTGHGSRPAAEDGNAGE